ncbi:unnamed protein product, partial [Polarella glacialis]
MCVGNFRPGPSGGPVMGAPCGGPPNGAPQRGMGDWRTGGPVRAKADLLGDAGVRRNRPATASPGRPGSRAPSPGPGQGPGMAGPPRSAPNSRPPSPQGRAPSPARE